MSRNVAPPAPSRRTMLAGFGGLLALSAMPLRPAAAATTGMIRTAPRAVTGEQMIHDWIDFCYRTIKADAPTPLRAARAYGYILASMYEAASSGLSLPSLAGKTAIFRDQPEAASDISWQVAMSRAAFTTVGRMLPGAQQNATRIFDKHLQASRNGLSGQAIGHSIEHGGRIADRALDFSDADGVAGLPTDYTPPVGPGLWVPTDDSPALEPYWSRVTPIVLKSSSEIGAKAPLPFSTAKGSAFYKDAKATYDVTVAITDDHKEIATRWDGPGTPMGHWLLIADHVCTRDGVSAADTLKALALAAMAMNDAVISCWHVKFKHNVVRPITYIREHIDADWTPVLATPPFPEYTSGHATASGAASVVLAQILGEKRFTDPRSDYDGVQERSYSSFAAAAAEGTKSRQYGGVHFPAGNNEGLAHGQRIGKRVLERLQ